MAGSRTSSIGAGTISWRSRLSATSPTFIASPRGRATTIDGTASAPSISSRLVKPRPEARFVVFHSYDDYTTNLPLADFDDDDVLIAHSWQGETLAREHGGPMRAIVPKLYFWKSAKWVKRIEFIARDRSGFWEANGYHDRGDPWQEERYA